MTLIDPVQLTMDSVACQSVTPADDGALDVMANALTSMGFTITRLRFDEDGTASIDNIFARLGSGGPHLCYMGHTDVVPAGRDADWTSPPFKPEIRNGLLYGRGVADMKGGNAAFAAAVSRFLHAKPDFRGSISFLLTGDEEAASINGTVKVIDWMLKNGQMPDVALVGEPSNINRLGDTMRVGRRGSLTGRLMVKGIQGHSAYPERARNPIPLMVPLLNVLIAEKFDDGTAEFPPTHLAFTSVDVGNMASNVIPAHIEAKFNMRFNDNWTKETLDTHLRHILNKVHTNYTLETRSNAPCFLTPGSPWLTLVSNAVEKISGIKPHHDTGGGTSDARFIAQHCPVVEYGLLNASIHKVDEHASIKDLEDLTRTYHEILMSYFS